MSAGFFLYLIGEVVPGKLWKSLSELGWGIILVIALAESRTLRGPGAGGLHSVTTSIRSPVRVWWGLDWERKPPDNSGSWGRRLEILSECHA